MSIRTISIEKMLLVFMLAMVPAGCSQHYVLRLSNPEEATTVTFFDQGDGDGEDDDTTIVLDEPNRIAKVAAFFEARAAKWHRLDDDLPQRRRRTAISFRKGDQPTDRFWLERDRLLFQQPDGRYFVCDLTDAERTELKNIFHFTTNFKTEK